MSEIQSDMFDHDPHINQLLAHMDKIPPADLESRWPRSLVELIDILEAELKRQGHTTEARILARKQALALSLYLGGVSITSLVETVCSPHYATI